MKAKTYYQFFNLQTHCSVSDNKNHYCITEVIYERQQAVMTKQNHDLFPSATDSPLSRRCGTEEEISAHILCECEALASLRHAYLDSFFLEPEDTKSMSLGTARNFSKVTGLP
jgi:hypothetical protein